MKTFSTFVILAILSLGISAQTDTISENIYQLNGNLGVGIDEPSHSVQIQNTIHSGIERNLLLLNNLSDGSLSYTGLLLKTGDGAYQSVIQDYGLNYTASAHYDFGGFLNLSNNSKGLMLHANSANGIIKFYTGHDPVAGAGIERLRINSNGNIGIGTKNPENALSIEGTEDDWPGRIFLSIKNNSISNKSLAYMELKAGSSGNHTILGHISETYGANDSPEDLQDFGILSSNGKGLILGALKNDLSAGIIKFCLGHSPGNTFNERMRINSDGNVGIGTKEPVELLDINGGLKIGNSLNSNPGTIRWTGENFEGFDGSEWLSFSSSSVNPWIENSKGIYYESGNIGIGSDLNDHLLELNANIGAGIERNLLKLHNNITSNLAYTGIILQTGSDIGSSVIQDYSTHYTASPAYDFAGFLNIGNSNNGIMFHTRKQGIIKFYTGFDASAGGGIERLRIDSAGNIGIGTKEPLARLHVADGDIFISDIDKGIIMKSPDGNCWRGTLDNAGNLNFVPVACPETTVNFENRNTDQASVTIYPVPTESKITVAIENLKVDDFRYTIHNVTGSKLAENRLDSNFESIDISDFEEGVYILNIWNQSGILIASKEIVKL